MLIELGGLTFVLHLFFSRREHSSFLLVKARARARDSEKLRNAKVFFLPPNEIMTRRELHLNSMNFSINLRARPIIAIARSLQARADAKLSAGISTRGAPYFPSFAAFFLYLSCPPQHANVYSSGVGS